jgi:hypothetical protein
MDFRGRGCGLFGLHLTERVLASMKIGLSMIGLLVLAAVANAAETRTWTFEQSGKTVRAEFIAFAGDSVILKGADGKSFSVPTAFLSEGDRNYLSAERLNQCKQIEVVKLENAESSGRYNKCIVRGAALNGEVYLQRLPTAVEAILNNRNAQAVQIASVSNRIELENHAVEQAKATLPSTAQSNRAYRRAVAAERAQVSQEAKDVKNARTSLAKLQKSYQDYVKKTKEQATVKMRNTGQEFNGLPVWECFDPRKPQE